MDQTPISTSPATRLRFGCLELTGTFGDLGMDLPLIIGILLATGAEVYGRM